MRLAFCIVGLVLSVFSGLWAAQAGAQTAQADREALKALYLRPRAIPFPETAPYSPQKAMLGKMLFFDTRLSGAKNMNCASCHNPSFGYEAPVPKAVGALNTVLPRHAPTILNAAWVEPFFWDGRAPDLEAQAAGPITAAAEMNAKFDVIVRELRAIPDYRAWFDGVFPDEGISEATVLSAIATYERTVVSGWAPFDHWVDGDETAITEAAKRGFDLFNGKAQCAGCHTGWNFTDNQFHDIGLGDADIGRAGVAPDEFEAQHGFKTPGLRNLSYRAPFMHNGALADLDAVIAHYESGGVPRPSKSPLMAPFALSAQERSDLRAFLESLTAEQSRTAMPNLPN
ncbi:MAG: cytochrome-c peroxidase [Maricaulaceae bacterium]